MTASPGAPGPASVRHRDRMDRALARISHAPPREGNRLTLLRDGPETYDEWIGRIRGAERWVHFENYFFLADEVGHRFAEALSEKAREGVPVRVIYDWFGSSDVPRAFWDGMRDAGVKVRAASPPTLRAPLRTFCRNHRKIVGVDGDYGSTGGVCVSEGWLQRSETGLIYRDTAVGVEGPAVADLEHAFARMWDTVGDPLPDAERPQADSIEGIGEGAEVHVVPQGPGKLRILRLIEFLTLAAEERLWIADPYFLSTPLLNRSLTSAAWDGVDVRILLPGTNDHPVIGLLERAGYRRYLEAGVRIFEYLGPMMHAKTTVADGRWSRVGSTNLNIASLATSWELDLVVEDHNFGERMEELFTQDFANSREIRPGRTARRANVKPEGATGGGATSGGATGATRPGERGASRAPAALSRVGAEVLRKGAAPEHATEQAVAAGTGIAVLGASLLGARYPRLVAWPLATAGAAVGGSVLLRAAQRIAQGPRERNPTEP
jgi:cardiolipin synthase A/B